MKWHAKQMYSSERRPAPRISHARIVMGGSRNTHRTSKAQARIALDRILFISAIRFRLDLSGFKI